MKQVLSTILFTLITISSKSFGYVVPQDEALIVTTTPPPPPHPYVFSYSAGRYPGTVDRTHTEVSDGSGTVRGAFSYVDPRQEIRTVEYVADKNGFHPILSHPIDESPRQSIAVQRETQKHLALYSRIAESHANPQENTALPRDTLSVANAKVKHADLFQKIAEEHALIAAERQAEQLAFEATSEKYDEQY